MINTATLKQSTTKACAILALATRQGGTTIEAGELFLLASIVKEQTERLLSGYRFEDQSGLVRDAICTADQLPALIENALAEAELIDQETNSRERAIEAQRRGAFWVTVQ